MFVFGAKSAIWSFFWSLSFYTSFLVCVFFLFVSLPLSGLGSGLDLDRNRFAFLCLKKKARLDWLQYHVQFGLVKRVI